MKQHIIELCLTTTDGLTPFAVIVEGDGSFAWEMPHRLGSTSDPAWSGYVLGCKERNPQEWWALEAWQEWLSDLGDLSPEKRRAAFHHLESSTPGIVIRKPRSLSTRLPAGALVTRWCRDRLFNRAEIVAAQIAANLSSHGAAYWNSALQIGEWKELRGDWVIEQRSRTKARTNLAILNILNASEVGTLHSKEPSNEPFLPEDKLPRRVVVVQNSRKAEITEWGCIVGDRFAAPVSLAVATIKSFWHRTMKATDSDNDQESSHT